MRSINTYLLAIAATAAVFIACRKDLDDDLSNRLSGPSKSGDCDLSLTVTCGMLSFEDEADMNLALECLDARYEAILEWLEQEYDGLDDDQFDAAVEQLGYNEDNAIIDFLAGLNYTSFWSEYESALEQFVEQGGEPWDFSMPNPFSSPFDAALRNKFGAVMVGGTIYVTLANGDELTFCDCQAYELYMADPAGYVLDPNDPCTGVIEKQVYSGGNGFECADYHKMCHWNSYTGNKNMKVKLIFEYNSEGTFAEARLDSWKKRNNGKWKRHYTKLRPRVYGNSNTVECVYRGSFDKTKTQRRARTRIANMAWPGGHHTFRKLEVKGDYS